VDAVRPDAATPTVIGAIPIGVQLLDGAAVVGDHVHVIARTPPTGDDPKRTSSLVLYRSTGGGAPTEERFLVPDASPAQLAANGDAILAAWFQQGHVRRELSLVRRGPAATAWTVAVPAGETPIGSPLLAPSRDRGWLVCSDTVAHHVICADVPATGTSPGAWRTIAPLAGAAPVALASTPSGVALFAQCTRGACKDHLALAAVAPPASGVRDLGVLANLAPIATIEGGLMVMGDRDPAHRAAMVVTPDEVRAIDLAGASYLTALGRHGGAWLFNAAGWSPWSPAGGLGAITPWPAELLAPIHGGVRELRPAGADTLVIAGLRTDGVLVVAVRMPPSS